MLRFLKGLFDAKQSVVEDTELFIYRIPGDRGAKDLSLHRERDYFTGLSFLSTPYSDDFIKFNIQRLRQAGFVVVSDGGELAKLLPFLGGGVYEHPDAGTIPLPEGHYTVYHPDQIYWRLWHEADTANLRTTNISDSLQRLYALREKE